MTTTSRNRTQLPQQMTFDERRQRRRDGKLRAKPGPKPKSHPNARHVARPTHRHTYPLHITMRAKAGLPSFRQQHLYAAFEKAFRTTRREDFRIVEYSVQADHLHLIVEADDKEALARGMASFSVRANRLFNAAQGRMRGRVWAERYHRTDLTSPRQVRRALVYCIQNYKKHLAITHGEPRVDAYSSGRWFTGWIGTCQHDDGKRPTPRASVYLLTTGWKRHGLIHAGERPSSA